MERRFNSLKELREYYKMSLTDVGKKLGVTPATIWQWEQHGNEWLKPRHRLMLLRAFSEEDLKEAFDPDWVPPEPEPEPEQEPEQGEKPEPEQKPEVVIAAKWMSTSGETTPADVISELMAVLAQLNLKEMTAVLNTAKLILATKNAAQQTAQQ